MGNEQIRVSQMYYVMQKKKEITILYNMYNAFILFTGLRKLVILGLWPRHLKYIDN